MCVRVAVVRRSVVSGLRADQFKEKSSAFQIKVRKSLTYILTALGLQSCGCGRGFLVEEQV